MKKLLLSILLLTAVASLNAKVVYVICRDNVRVHIEEDLSSPVSGELHLNDTVKLINMTSEWAFVDYGGTTGFVLKYYLSKVEIPDKVVAIDTVPETKHNTPAQDTVKALPATTDSAVVDTVKAQAINAGTSVTDSLSSETQPSDTTKTNTASGDVVTSDIQQSDNAAVNTSKTTDNKDKATSKSKKKKSATRKSKEKK